MTMIDKAEALAVVNDYWQSIGGGLPEGPSDEAILGAVDAIAERIAALTTDAAQAREAAMQELIDAYEDIIDYGPLVLAKKDQWKRVEAAKGKLK